MVGFGPLSELIFDGGDDALQEAEVAIMETQPAREFPDPFDGIEIRAIGWQEVQAELGSLLAAPLQMEFGAVILCVVADGQNAAAGDGANFPEHFQELPEGLSIESSDLAAEEKHAVPQTHGGKVTHALARRMMVHDGILGLRRNPHAAARSLLLKVHFVHSPQVHRTVRHQFAEFFLCFFWRTGSARAKTGRGLRSRNSNCRKHRWHWRTPSWTPYVWSIHADRVLPSHRFTRIPASLGLARKTRLISFTCFWSSRLRRPLRSPSVTPASPYWSKR